jgi:hypothetical protein
MGLHVQEGGVVHDHERRRRVLVLPGLDLGGGWVDEPGERRPVGVGGLVREVGVDRRDPHVNVVPASVQAHGVPGLQPDRVGEAVREPHPLALAAVHHAEVVERAVAGEGPGLLEGLVAGDRHLGERPEAGQDRGPQARQAQVAADDLAAVGQDVGHDGARLADLERGHAAGGVVDLPPQRGVPGGVDEQVRGRAGDGQQERGHQDGHQGGREPQQAERRATEASHRAALRSRGPVRAAGPPG